MGCSAAAAADATTKLLHSELGNEEERKIGPRKIWVVMRLSWAIFPAAEEVRYYELSLFQMRLGKKNKRRIWVPCMKCQTPLPQMKMDVSPLVNLFCSSSRPYLYCMCKMRNYSLLKKSHSHGLKITQNVSFELFNLAFFKNLSQLKVTYLVTLFDR